MSTVQRATICFYQTMLILVILAAGSGSWAGAEKGRAVAQAITQDDEWPSHGRSPYERRFSPLRQINTDNVAQLGLTWSVEFPTHRGLEATPLVVDGVLYTSISWSVVYAIDARTGEVKWIFDPEVPKQWGGYACCDVVSRGVAYHDNKIFVGTLDGRLIALNALTGQRVWEKNTIDNERPYTITGAPRIVKGQVLIGNGGSEYGVRGYVSAYDALTGKLNWRFYTVPGDPREPVENPALSQAIPTWDGNWWTVGGGGTVWDSMSYDPELDLLYIGTGNGAPWNRVHRSNGKGDNLYLSSIIALEPDTGEMRWYYQTTPGDTWDFTATQQMILADLVIDGKGRKVLMQAPKNGFFYVLDRITGELLSAEAFTEVTWASHVDLKTGRPVEAEGARYESGEAKFLKPGTGGAHSWQPMSYNGNTGLVYIPVLDAGYIYKQGKQRAYQPRRWNTGIDERVANQHLPKDLLFGNLLAWDPVAQQEVWRVDHEFVWNGGVLSTAGSLVFQGKGQGDFVAYDAEDGRKLWSFDTHNGVIAAPMSYSLDGEQHVAIMSGWGGIFPLVGGEAAKVVGVRNQGGRLLVFKLGANKQLPEPPRLPAPDEPPKVDKQDVLFKQGEGLFAELCARCHGAAAISGGVIKDVRFAHPGTLDNLDRILLDGILEPIGMPNFDGIVSAQDVDALKHYMAVKARLDYEAGSNWYQ